jgi:hypothetical protein
LTVNYIEPVNINGWPAVDTPTKKGFIIRAQINEDGTAYYVILADGEAAPTASEVEAGTASGGGGTLASGSFALTANTEGTAVIDTLNDNTEYDVYIVAKNSATILQSSAVKVDIATKRKSRTEPTPASVTTPAPTPTPIPMPTPIVEPLPNEILVTSTGVKGLFDNEYFNAPVNIKVIEGSATLDEYPIVNQTIVNEDGTHKLSFTNADGTINMSYNFTIDTISPEISGIVNGGEYNTDVTIQFNEGTANLNGNTFVSGSVVSEAGEYFLKVIDFAGNITEANFTIQKGKVIGISNGGVYEKSVSITIQYGEGYLNQKYVKGRFIVNEQGRHTLVVNYEDGRVETIYFEIVEKLPIAVDIPEDNVDNNSTMENLTLPQVLREINRDPRQHEFYPLVAKLMEKENDTGIKIFTNGLLVDFDLYNNVQPIIVNGRTLVPIRAVCENIDINVNWDEKARKVSLKVGHKSLEIVIDSKEAIVDGNSINLDVPPTIINGRTLVPLRFIAENFGYDVKWFDEGGKTRVVSLF